GHARVELEQVIGLECRLRTEVLDEQRREQLHERTAAAELHLERQALALVHRHRPRLRHRLTEPRKRPALLVAAVAGLVDRPHQALFEVVLAVARGETDVLGYAAGEWMRADVEPPAIEVELQELHHALAQRLLRGDRERPLR